VAIDGLERELRNDLNELREKLELLGEEEPISYGEVEKSQEAAEDKASKYLNLLWRAANMDGADYRRLAKAQSPRQFCTGALLLQHGRADLASVNKTAEDPQNGTFECRYCNLDVVCYRAIRTNKDDQVLESRALIAASHLQSCMSLSDPGAFYRCLACLQQGGEEVDFATVIALEHHMEIHSGFEVVYGREDVQRGTVVVAEEARRFLSDDKDTSPRIQLFSRKSDVVRSGGDEEDTAELSDGEAIIQGHESVANPVAEQDESSDSEGFELGPPPPVNEMEVKGIDGVQVMDTTIPSSTLPVVLPTEPSMNQAYEGLIVAEPPAIVVSNRERRQPTDAYDPFCTPAMQFSDSVASESRVPRIKHPVELPAVSIPQELGPGTVSPRDHYGNLLPEVDGTSAPHRGRRQAQRAADEPQWSADDFPSLQIPASDAQGGQGRTVKPLVTRRPVKPGRGTPSMPGTFITPSSSNSSLQDTAARQA
jgi:hypothetical protein